MNLREHVEYEIRNNRLKQEQLAVLNYVKRVTKDGSSVIQISEKDWGNLPPVIFEIFNDKKYFEENTGVHPLTPGYYGLSARGEEYRQKVEKELKEN